MQERERASERTGWLWCGLANISTFERNRWLRSIVVYHDNFLVLIICTSVCNARFHRLDIYRLEWNVQFILEILVCLFCWLSNCNRTIRLQCFINTLIKMKIYWKYASLAHRKNESGRFFYGKAYKYRKLNFSMQFAIIIDLKAIFKHIECICIYIWCTFLITFHLVHMNGQSTFNGKFKW